MVFNCKICLKPKKYIFLSFSSRGKNLKYYELDSDGFFVGSWAGLIARRLKNYKPELDISIWRIEPVVERPLKRRIFNLDGIIWPTRFVIIKNVLSLGMYLTFLKLSIRNDIILHFHSLFDRFILIRFFLPSNVKIVLSHHGGIPPGDKSLKDFFFRMMYKHASAITYLSSSVKDYLLNINVSAEKIFFLPVGGDFNNFKPNDKQIVRKELNLRPDTVYGIYVGAFYKLKSVDIILDIYNKLKYKYNFSIIFVGGEDNMANDMYQEVIDSGCPYFERQKWTDMQKFYNAADFYIHPAFNPLFGGLDVTWIEALACNIPVLSPQLDYLDFDHSELGLVVKDTEDALGKTEYMVKNHMNYKKCREVAIKHLDGNNSIMKKLMLIYNSI